MLCMFLAFALCGTAQSATEKWVQNGGKTVTEATEQPFKSALIFNSADAGVIVPTCKKVAGPVFVDTGNPDKDLAVYKTAKEKYLADLKASEVKVPHKMTQAEFDGLRADKKEIVLKHPEEFTIVNDKN